MSNAITQLQLANFTKFRDLNIEFSPKINIIIGENGTGKTHLLKAAYMFSGAAALDSELDAADRAESRIGKLEGLFKPIGGDVGRLVRRPLKSQRHASLVATFLAGGIEIKIPSKQGGTISGAETKVQLLSGPPIFIPAKEVMSLLGGMTNEQSDKLTLKRLFDDTYFDLCSQLIKDPVEDEGKAIEKDPRFGSVYEKLADAIDGKFVFKGGIVVFYPGEYEGKFRNDPRENPEGGDPEMYEISDTKVSRFVRKTGEPVSAHMTAEGMRKLGVIQRLLLNRALSPGITGPLIWDEPETNMNPKLLHRIVDTLLELSRNGQQIILATHDYVLLKWFDLLMDKGKGDHVRFHTLFKDPSDSEIKLESTNDYLAIAPNAIVEAFNDLTIAHARLRLRGSVQ